MQLVLNALDLNLLYISTTKLLFLAILGFCWLFWAHDDGRAVAFRSLAAGGI
eukprot:SAG11_NODE_1933_length_4040_cov_12.707435_3_plen_52_part_00